MASGLCPHREAAAYGTWMIQATEAPAPATA
ncbi:hypothetical protein SNOG_12806 [Parastagonospora nodorum SN15]|uniref:Uncharacterized protein n=1 Tax=Phaeosphaeria nodorum (strain SN15 / ATCC MYA-4574 / FGSC 10173) TaxID=321614 RepID=Q0U608_PHANO|nr:hypothetical protein SNOG_12806 [Parastagonospora nodorum SN15]EAT79606.1 hypothetical protein SNOG_12806 [Parastagonospora nodorum SN15]